VGGAGGTVGGAEELKSEKWMWLRDDEVMIAYLTGVR
jgi:hypothetical protein